MANTIQHKRSSTSGAAPAATGLSQGELAINIADGKVYTKNNANSIINLGVTSISGTSITPSSGNFTNYLAVNGVPVSVSGHSHTSVPQAQSIVTNVFNKTASTIPKFSVVYIDGGQGDQPTIQLAIANGESGSSKTYGITAEAISSMSAGSVIVAGALSGINTDQFNPTAPAGNVNGVTLYLSPSVSGAATTTKPYAPNHLVSIGTIVRTHQNQGVVEVRVQNGFELQELHDVAVTGVTDGQFLYYDGSSDLWQPNSNIYSNGTNIGIGTNSPTVKLEVAGDIYGNNVLSTGYLISNALLSVNDFDGGTPGTIYIGELTSLNHPYWTIDQNGSGNFSTLSVNDTIVSLNGHTHSSSDITNFNSSVSGLLPTISNSGDNRVLTSTGSTVGTNAESNLTFNGNLLNIIGSGRLTGDLSASGSIIAGSGTAALPTFEFVNDTDTGLFSPTNDTIGFATSGVERLRINNIGRIGVGTNSPQELLHVNGAISSSSGNLLRLNNTSSTNNPAINFRIGGVGNFDNHFFINRNGTDVFGIDTTNRGVFLNTFSLSATRQFQSYNNSNAFLELQQTTANDATSNCRIGWISPANLIFLASYTERMRLTAAGNLGIGTNSPNELLEVSGNLRLSDKTGTGFKMQFSRGGGTANDYTIGREGNHLAISTASDGSTFRFTEFGYHAAGTWTPKTRINNFTGAMGVNLTAAPSGSLDVGGDIYVRGAAGTTGVLYLKSGTLADTTCRVRTDTNGNIFLDGGSAAVRCGSQDGGIDMFASSQWVTIGHTYDAGTANQYIRFVPANTEMMRVTRSGVGFGGVTSPLDRIHVSGTQTTIRMNNGLGYDTQLRMVDTVSDWSIGINQGNTAGSGVFSIRSNTASSHRLIINPSGNIGIGTITPSGRLHVLGNSIFTGDTTITGSVIASSGGASTPTFEFLNDSDTGMFNPSANAIGFSTSGVERVRIDSIGNVGIGTANTSAKLHVNGMLYVAADGADPFSGSEGIVIGTDGSISSTDSGPGSLFSITPGYGLRLYANGGAGGGVIFSTDRENSRIGIGIETPSETLDVNGTLKTLGFKSYGIGWFGAGNGSVGLGVNDNPSGTFGSSSAFAALQGFNDAVSSYNPICLTTQNAPQLYLNTNGNVGIGTATPSTKLQVNGLVSQSPNHVVAGLSSDQTITAGTDTVIQMTDKDDPNNWWNASTYRFLPNVSGNYFVSAQVNWKADTGTGQINSQLRKNGTAFCLVQNPQVSGVTLTQVLTGIVNLNGSTDYVELTGYSSATDGSQLVTGTADRAWTKLEAYKIS